MRNILKNSLILAAIMQIALTSNSHAIAKLDFPGPISDAINQIQKFGEGVEQKYNAVMETLNTKVRQAVGAEGAALFSVFVKKIERNVVRGVINQDFSVNGLFGDVTNMKLDYATYKNLAEDYSGALQKEKMKKNQDINAEIARLEALYKVEKDPEKIDEISKQIAELQAQKQANLKQQSLRDEKIQEYQEKTRTLSSSLQDLNAATEHEEILKKLENRSRAMFEEEEDPEVEKQELAGLVQKDISEFFIAEYDHVGKDNVNKVMKVRKTEYYKAFLNMYKSTITSDKKTQEISEDSVTMVDTSTQEADGLYGAMAMRIGADIQTAKTAARFTELLLAEIRFNTTQDMQTWHDKYKMYDYDKDPTTFNLDDYVLKEKDYKQDFVSKQISKQKNSMLDKISNWQGL